MTLRYEAIRQDDPVLRERLKDLAKVRRRFGYRRLHVFLRREGHQVNHKRLFRIYREEQLHVRRRGGRKRAMGTRAPMALTLMPNQRWSLDFVSDQLTNGRRFRILTVVDDWVILPVLTGFGRRTHAAIFSFCAGVMPPMPMLGRSLL